MSETNDVDLVVSFRESLPEYGQFVAFVCPIQKDRWNIGWMDMYKFRVEGGESFEPEDLSFWHPLPSIPESQRSSSLAARGLSVCNKHRKHKRGNRL